MAGNVYERIAQHICEQIHPDVELVKDYDQLLNKRPNKDDAVFGWHQVSRYGVEGRGQTRRQ